MPELPEAETIARQLQRQIAGQTLGRVYLAREDIIKSPKIDLPQLLAGRRVKRVYRRAKRVVLDLDPAATIVVGLGMTGRLGVVPSSSEIEKHTHLRIELPALNSELRFRDPRRFGGIWIYGSEKDVQGGDVLPDLGIEPLTCAPKQFRSLLSRKRQIKALLMDQRTIAGLGNIYCDESLHAARIHPLTRSSRLSVAQADALLKAIKDVLRRAIRSKGSTLLDYRDADGHEGSFQKLHRVYDREGEACRNCDTPIKKIIAAGRSTHFCPRCQKQKK